MRHLLNPTDEVRNIPEAHLMLIISGLLLLVGGLGIILGVYVSVAVICLVVFLVPVTLVMHPFWKETDPVLRMTNRISFFKNIALIGASLAFLFIPQPWPLALS